MRTVAAGVQERPPSLVVSKARTDRGPAARLTGRTPSVGEEKTGSA